MSDSIERVIAEMLAVRAPDFGSPPAREAIYCWATRLRSLRQVPDGELRAIADAIPDGTASFENTDHGRAAAAFYAAALNAFCNPAPTTSVEVETFDDLVMKSQPVRTFDEIAAPTPAQAGAELPEYIDPNSLNFKEGLAVGMSCEQRLADLIRNPVCDRCGARNAEEASKVCSPDGDSCPGAEFPLTNLWGDA